MTQERGKLVENDGFIKIKNMEYKYEFNQAAKRGKLRAVADASFNRDFHRRWRRRPGLWKRKIVNINGKVLV